MVEFSRGCGYRVVGGVYLCGQGPSAICDALPVELGNCECCDFMVKQSRSMQPVHLGYLAMKLKDHKCHENFKGCPLCFYANVYPELKKLDRVEQKKRKIPKVFYLMFVSKNYYSPESFVEEAVEMGVSKRIAPNCLPKNFKLGEDWVFLAHREVAYVASLEAGALQAEAVYKRAIFYAFKPTRLELLLWKGTSSKTIREYEKAGYTVVLVDKSKENLEKHREVALPPLPNKKKQKKVVEKGVLF